LTKIGQAAATRLPHHQNLGDGLDLPLHLPPSQTTPVADIVLPLPGDWDSDGRRTPVNTGGRGLPAAGMAASMARHTSGSATGMDRNRHINQRGGAADSMFSAKFHAASQSHSPKLSNWLFFMGLLLVCLMTPYIHPFLYLI
jgi:hypothetical protein